MYNLIAIDLDGTLLNSYGEITKEDKIALKKQIKKGVEVVLTSGRTISAMQNFAEEIGAKNYIISGNGTVIYDMQNEKKIYKKYLSKKKALEIANICEKNSMHYNIDTDKSIITKSLNYNTLFYYSENLKKTAEKRTNIEVVPNIISYLKKLNEPILKITICDNDEIIFNSIIKKIKKVKNIDVLEVAHMSRKTVRIDDNEKQIEYYYTEITTEGADKWEAIKYLSNKMKIPKEKIITIGDNTNDINMIKNAGLGIAMGNSNLNVKKMAQIITYDNNHSGVGKIIDIINT